MIGTPTRTNAILQKYHLRTNKQLGQNFLVDENILKKTVDYSQITSEDAVIEIGPGIGALTEVLVGRAKKVLVYEIDERFIQVLENELSYANNLQIKHCDFLKADITDDLLWFSDCNLVYVISNIPYYITTPIVSKLLKQDFVFQTIILLMQKEVGMRLAAKPSTKDYNAFSVFVQFKSKVNIVFEVSKKCFIPQPLVDSVIVQITPNQLDGLDFQEEHFLSFVQNIFQNRRKTLINNIINAYPLTRVESEQALTEQGLNLNVRSESLTSNEIINLYRRIINYIKTR
jgi:16S rRNA (adenine1518-N6/adenine1519-N6)-dimethyltransferase